MPRGSQHVHAEVERVLGGVADTITRHVLPPGAPANDPTADATPPANPPSGSLPVVNVELISGQLVEVPSPIAAVGQFDGLPLLGPIAQMDRRLNGWIKRVLDYGIFSPRLGEMLLIPLLVQDAADRPRSRGPDRHGVARSLHTQRPAVSLLAGHGIFDPATGRRGWVFGDDCTLTAKEIFKARQVPRLVFANACLFSAVEAGRDPLPAVAIQQVSLAEAFFARGIENYIGAGWPVEDGGAEAFTTEFYLRALGINVLSRETLELRGTAPPALISEALAAARRCLLDLVGTWTGNDKVCSLWGAYQHYGQINAKLLPFENLPAPRPEPDAGSASRTCGPADRAAT